MKTDITTVYFFLDEFYKLYAKEMQKIELPKKKKQTRHPKITMPEILTILVMYNFSYFKNFKAYYIMGVKQSDFHNKPSYNRFIELIPRALAVLSVLLKNLCINNKNAEKFIDATLLSVCHNKRITRNKVFKGLAAIGKTTKGWGFGFKLHLIIDTKGNIANLCITKANCDDRDVVDSLTTDIIGNIYGDKGYISIKLFKKLFARGLRLVTGIKKNMNNKLMSLYDKIMLRKRSLIETVFDYLKNTFNIEHSRHRSPCNAFVHIISVLIAYSIKNSKPNISANAFLLKGINT